MEKETITAGIDEVGRGCLAGPVVSAAVILKEGINLDLLKDSKKISFKKRLDQIKWEEYYKSWPFNESALALYNWAPVANELKTLDRKIVLNSMILKWDNIKEEFSKLIKI